MFEEIVTVAYLQVIWIKMHEKDTATEAYLKPSQKFIMRVFLRKELTAWHGYNYISER